jgi:23S rRNA (cytosine1962-C5)-methyltransferase
MQALLDAISHLTLPSTDAQRVFHGRGGLHPGSERWSLDFFPPVWVLTRFAALDDSEAAELEQIGAALEQRWKQIAPNEPLNWVFQRRHAQGAETRVMVGSVPQPHIVAEADTQYIVHVDRGQNHGLFLDMAAGRAWVRRCVASHISSRANNGRAPIVLNLFAYTCAFSVVAMQAGARQVVNVDMARVAMTTGQQNHQLNGITAGASFLVHDIFRTWGKISRPRPYDLVIVDPPSYQKGSFIATKDYARLIRRLPDLVAPSGHALLCLNAPELDTAFLQSQVAELAPSLRFIERVANPEVFADKDEERSLKVLVYQEPAVGATLPPSAV